MLTFNFSHAASLGTIYALLNSYIYIYIYIYIYDACLGTLCGTLVFLMLSVSVQCTDLQAFLKWFQLLAVNEFKGGLDLKTSLSCAVVGIQNATSFKGFKTS